MVRVTLFYVIGIGVAIRWPGIFGIQWVIAGTACYVVFRYGAIGLITVFLFGYVRTDIHTAKNDPDHLIHQTAPIPFYKVIVTRYAEEKANSWKLETSISGTYTGNVVLYLSKKDFPQPYSYGDILLIRTGYYGRRLTQGPRSPLKDGSPAAHVACAPWFRERGVAMLGTDTHNDVSPLPYPRLGNALHIVSLVAMGLWLIDNGNLEELAAACRLRGRWEFMLTLAPLRLQGTTGSPVNPIALF